MGAAPARGRWGSGEWGEVEVAAGAFPRLTRRRGSGLEAAIRDAVIELLGSIGFEAMTMEQVAAAAGTGKAALYRRWPTKNDLVLDTLAQFVDLEWPLPDTGSLRGDLVAALSLVAESMEDPLARGAAAALAELPGSPTRRSQLRGRFLAARRDALLVLVDRAVQRGESVRSASPVVAEAALALLMYRVLSDGLPVDRRVLQAAVDDVVMPLVQLDRPAAPPTPAPRPSRRSRAAGVLPGKLRRG